MTQKSGYEEKHEVRTTTVKFDGDNLTVAFIKNGYTNGNNKLMIFDERGDVYATISVMIRFQEQKDLEIFIQGWGENEVIVRWLRSYPSLFADTGRRIATKADPPRWHEVWRLAEDTVGTVEARWNISQPISPQMLDEANSVASLFNLTQQQLFRVKKENQQLRAENDVLKKATRENLELRAQILALRAYEKKDAQRILDLEHVIEEMRTILDDVCKKL